jgi:hypothetical protein
MKPLFWALSLLLLHVVASHGHQLRHRVLELPQLTPLNTEDVEDTRQQRVDQTLKIEKSRLNQLQPCGCNSIHRMGKMPQQEYFNFLELEDGTTHHMKCCGIGKFANTIWKGVKTAASKIKEAGKDVVEAGVQKAAEQFDIPIKEKVNLSDDKRYIAPDGSASLPSQVVNNDIILSSLAQLYAHESDEKNPIIYHALSSKISSTSHSGNTLGQKIDNWVLNWNGIVRLWKVTDTGECINGYRGTMNTKITDWLDNLNSKKITLKRSKDDIADNVCVHAGHDLYYYYY